MSSTEQRRCQRFRLGEIGAAVRCLRWCLWGSTSVQEMFHVTSTSAALPSCLWQYHLQGGSQYIQTQIYLNTDKRPRCTYDIVLLGRPSCSRNRSLWRIPENLQGKVFMYPSKDLLSHSLKKVLKWSVNRHFDFILLEHESAAYFVHGLCGKPEKVSQSTALWLVSAQKLKCFASLKKKRRLKRIIRSSEWR